jgi:hypothetical protein
VINAQCCRHAAFFKQFMVHLSTIHGGQTQPLGTSKCIANMICANPFQKLGSILTWYVIDPPFGRSIRSVEQLLFKCPQGRTIETSEVFSFQHILGRAAQLLPTNAALQKLHHDSSSSSPSSNDSCKI